MTNKYPISYWKRWFAWYPVTVMHGQVEGWAWLETVERRQIHEVSLFPGMTVPAHRYYLEHRALEYGY